MRNLLRTASCLLFLGLAMAAHAEESLNHYGVASIPDKQVEADFTARFNAQGRPVFLIGDLRRGVSIGDIIRFKNKVILIDEEVWQTMKSAGVLDKIRNAAVVELSAQSSGEVWKSRADLAEGREKIAYTLGAEFITILEEYFGRVPDKAEIGFRFEGNKMTVMAPNELLGMLRFVGKPGGKKPEIPNTQPSIISEPPRRAFEDQPFSWTLWAVDRAAPSTDLDYSIDSRLPQGLHWDDRTHSITGKPEKAGAWKVKARAQNAAKHSDELVFDLIVTRNGKPKIGGEPARETGPDGLWQFQPYISDPDHLVSELKLKPFAMPDGMNFDAATRTFSMRVKDASQVSQLTFGLEAVDPLGAADKRTFNLAAPSALRFESALNSNELLQGQSSYYTPVALGPGRDIRYLARSENGAVELAGGRIPLATLSPGSHVVEISAEDELGNQARQMVSYQVLSHEALAQNLDFRIRQVDGGAHADVFYRLGRARLGALFTEVDKASLPFFFAGFEPLPASLAGSDNRMYLDMGFNFAGGSGVTSGGFMLRLDGRHNRLRDNPFFFTYLAQYHARQGILLFNPQDFKKNQLGDKKLETCLKDLRSRTDQADSLMAGFLGCSEDADRLMDAYGNGDNEVLLVELLLGLNLGHAVGIGPAYWLENRFHSDRGFEQRVGAALSHEGAFKWVGYSASLKVGFGRDLPKPKVLLDFSMSFGRED
ncbi:MAG: hypothetical protein JWP91_2068 [Fibrobacteres bacterium]|nr:hypothetical protein [Fibrobacterota bacterium]